MKPGRRTSIAVFLALAVLAGMPGIAGCLTCPSPAGAVMPCCVSGGGAASVHAASCCRTHASAPLAQPAQAVAPSVAPAVLSAPADLPSESVPAPRIAGLPPVPPSRHEGVGLYTLNATFLI